MVTDSLLVVLGIASVALGAVGAAAAVRHAGSLDHAPARTLTRLRYTAALGMAGALLCLLPLLTWR